MNDLGWSSFEPLSAKTNYRHLKWTLLQRWTRHRTCPETRLIRTIQKANKDFLECTILTLHLAHSDHYGLAPPSTTVCYRYQYLQRVL